MYALLYLFIYLFICGSTSHARNVLLTMTKDGVVRLWSQNTFPNISRVFAMAGVLSLDTLEEYSSSTLSTPPPPFYPPINSKMLSRPPRVHWLDFSQVFNFLVLAAESPWDEHCSAELNDMAVSNRMKVSDSFYDCPDFLMCVQANGSVVVWVVQVGASDASECSCISGVGF